jgi:hypothetical protein
MSFSGCAGRHMPLLLGAISQAALLTASYDRSLMHPMFFKRQKIRKFLEGIW